MIAAAAASTPQDPPASDDAFEAALRNAPAPPARPAGDFEDALARTRTADRPAPRTVSGRGASGGIKIAPAGMIPAHWRGTRGIDAAGWRTAKNEARDGALDPFAFAEMIFGRFPLPSGASPARCTNRLGHLVYTLGVPVSAEYDRALAEYQRNGDQIGKPSFLMDHGKMAEKATVKTMAEVERFYISKGFRKVPDASRLGRMVFIRADAPDERSSIRFIVATNGFMEKAMCRDYAKLDIPTGPVIHVQIPSPR
jgi:hypothetical protein